MKIVMVFRELREVRAEVQIRRLQCPMKELDLPAVAAAQCLLGNADERGEACPVPAETMA